MPTSDPPSDAVSGNLFNTASDGLTWSTPLQERIAIAMGWLYIACITLWLLITACLKAPLRYEECERWNPGYRVWRKLAHAGWATLAEPSIAWRITLAVSCFMSSFFGEYWLYSFLLADFFCQNTALGNVLGAIVNHDDL